ncbi:MULTISPECIES: hypothetical protein [unclassified Moritella]|uniref:hypothetical protein n=1 Tax=unclassified Moritella TaxID=2637987 RepID=UPI001BAC843D|nr:MULTISPECIES: hypothetical protein [unclassified Moritella]QUM80346.1 hypothetical protein HWV01_08635 [Moritella sp. 5]QUM84620.1 hypothetical protein HWV02_08945 [Moritella sp. 28]
MYNLNRFFEEITQLAPSYIAHHSWVSWDWTQSDNILNSWWLYKNAKKSSLGFLLLGGTQIRKDEALLFNFGLSSHGGVQEKEELALVSRLIEKRCELRKQTPLINSNSMVSTGSVLSDKNWNPILNDCFILGGVTGLQDFHLAESRYNQFSITINPSIRNKMSDKDKWKCYFQCYIGDIWDYKYNVPRVFARELLGLKLFGYKPVFKFGQLFFTPGDKSKASTASFTAYLNYLIKTGTTSSNPRKTLMEIASFLFDDPECLLK